LFNCEGARIDLLNETDVRKDLKNQRHVQQGCHGWLPGVPWHVPGSRCFFWPWWSSAAAALTQTMEMTKQNTQPWGHTYMHVPGQHTIGVRKQLAIT
jgi:hypothetical protein